MVYGVMEAWWSRERYRVVMGRVHARKRERGGSYGGIDGAGGREVGF